MEPTNGEGPDGSSLVWTLIVSGIYKANSPTEAGILVTSQIREHGQLDQLQRQQTCRCSTSYSSSCHRASFTTYLPSSQTEPST